MYLEIYNTYRHFEVVSNVFSLEIYVVHNSLLFQSVMTFGLVRIVRRSVTGGVDTTKLDVTVT